MQGIKHSAGITARTTWPLTGNGAGGGKGPERGADDHLVAELSAFVVVFHPRQTDLAATELAALRRWSRTWLHPERGIGAIAVVLGCCADTSREDRRRRLYALTRQLVECGVPPEMIRPTPQWVEPAWQRDDDELPADVAWLQAVEANPVPGARDAGLGATAVRQ